MKRIQSGFTLIELMITVAIIGILASIAYPSYVEQIAKGRRNECRSALLQTMMQQERFFTQRNTYALYASNASSAPARTFSADNSQNSSCTIAAVACTTPGSTDAAQCIESRASLIDDPASIRYIYIDTDGRKGCEIAGARTTDKKCWP